MKILFLLTQDLESPSGLGRYLPMAKELVKAGHEIHIATLHPNFENLQTTSFIWEGILINYVAPMHVRKPGNIKTYYPLRQFLLVVLQATVALTRAALQSNADLILLCKPHPMNSIATLLVSKLEGIPFVLDSDDYEAGYGQSQGRFQNRIISWFENNIPRRANAVITNTHFNETRMKSFGVLDEKLHYISNGIDLERFQTVDQQLIDEIKHKYSLGSKKIVGYIGSLSSPTHPVHLLIDAFAMLLEKNPNPVLMIIGGGQDYGRLKSQIEELRLQNNVHLIGRISPEKVPEYYRICDIAVEPVYDDDSARGRSPLKLFESWISHVPFITGNVGDRRELLGEPPAGVLIEPGNVKELAEAMSALIGDDKRRHQLAQRGTERVRQYSWSHLATKINPILARAAKDG